ncbi:hypothetical protein ACB098_08G010200 [Castanea mollissima]
MWFVRILHSVCALCACERESCLVWKTIFEIIAHSSTKFHHRNQFGMITWDQRKCVLTSDT